MSISLFPSTDTGYYALEIVESSGKRWRRWFRDPAELDTLVAQQSVANRNLYWRIAQYKTQDNCKTENVASVGMVAFDVDIRDYGAHYRNINDLLRDLDTFVRQFNLPDPAVVHSGGGLHIYWPLAVPMGVAGWKLLARGMIAAANSVGFQVDVGPSSNPTGLLRVIGTTNAKYGRAVRLLNKTDIAPTQPLALAQKIARFIPSAQSNTDSARHLFPPDILRGPARGLNYGYVEPERSMEVMLSECAQMRQAPSGSEPLWRAGLSVIRVFPNWREQAEKWSARAGDRFDQAAFDARADHLDALPPMPTRCDTFNGLNPGVCGTCANYGRVGSPVRLSVVSEPVEPAPEAESASEPPADAVPPPSLAEFVAAADIALPPMMLDGTELVFSDPGEDTPPDDLQGQEFEEAYGYFTADNGIPCKKIFEVDKETGEKVHVSNLELFSGPVNIIARVDTSSSGVREDAVVIDFHYHGDVIRVIPPLALLASHSDNSSLFKYLANYSILAPIPSIAKELATWLRVAVSGCHRTMPKLRNSESMGWTKHGFVVGDVEARLDGSTAPAWLVGSAHARARRYNCDGAVEAWRAVPDTYLKQDRVEAQFALMQSFASPLMPMTGESGLLVHLHSNDSGTGKSTILRAINSVWGDGNRLMMTSRDTENSTARLFTVAQNLPATIDELTNMEPRTVSNLVFSATQGTQKNRLTQTAEVRETGQWSLIAVTSGNESLRAKLSLNGRSDSEAENMRILELRIPRISKFQVDEATTLDDAMRLNPGVAGRHYARWLTKNKVAVEAAVAAAKRRWSSRLATQASERFWIASLAATEVAFTLSKQAGLHSFSWARMERWIIDTLIPSQRSQVRSAADEHVSEDFVDNLLAETQPSTLTVRCAVRGRGAYADGQGSGGFAFTDPPRIVARLEKDTGTLYLSCAAVSEFARRQGLPRARASELLGRAAGYAYSGTVDIKLASGIVREDSMGRTRCHKLVALRDSATTTETTTTEQIMIINPSSIPLIGAL